ncbi:MAG TPA: DUF177 domain-containing protein [Thermoanaerobaculia bacterium]|nr:DUF177 domain-containing protein [Thermoanaerobaculia bacterium]
MERAFIHFDDIDKYGLQRYSRSFDLEAGEIDRYEVESIGGARIEAKADKGELAGEYVVEGEVACTADLRCARCVEPFPFAITSPFHLRYRARQEAPEQTEEEVEISAGELDVDFYSERSLSLREMAIAQIQLSIPMKPLCDESCLGLCPQCGANRSREGCSCRSEATDERWGALGGIRELLTKKDQ